MMNFSKITFRLLLLGAVTFSLGSCTDLADVAEDARDEEQIDENLPLPQNASTALEGVYSQLNGLTDQANVYALLEQTSDEMMGPTRGTDWSDFGVWRQLHLHNWDASHAFVLSAFRQLTSGVFTANQVIAATTDPVIKAEALFLRAFFMNQVVDLYGQVPVREATQGFGSLPVVLSRAEATQQVIDNLTEAMANLPAFDASNTGRASKLAARALLTKVYLNRGVYTAADPAGPYNFSSEDMQKVIDNADAVLNSGSVSLQPRGEYFKIFGPDNSIETNEIIFGINNETGNALGSAANRYFMTLHYNQNPSGWNGFTTIADFYNRWDQSDERFRGSYDGVTDVSGLLVGFLQGQQLNGAGEPVNDRAGNPLSFTVEADLFYATEAAGVRVIKYAPDYANLNSPGNDYVFSRYADVHLMKAEALWRMGNTQGAVDMVNALRTARNAPSISTISADGSEILNERGFELYWEGFRRNDQIRFGTFLNAWTNKPASDPSRVLFPIPQVSLDANPNLQQNAGY